MYAPPYIYDRRRHLPFILRVPGDWLSSKDPAIAALILDRLDQAKCDHLRNNAIARAIDWAQEGERLRL